MMLKERLNSDLKEAMKSKDVAGRDTLRLLLAAIKQVEVDQQTDLSNEEIQALLVKQAKQRQESIAAYEQAGRQDLAAPELAELAVIEKYLPQMMDRDEIKEVAQEVIATVGADGPRAMGQVMGRLMARLKGKADGRLVNEVVRELLNDG